MGFFSKRKSDNAQELLELAITYENSGDSLKAKEIYNKIIKLKPDWSTPNYNLGLIYKYKCEWASSFEHNKKAVELDSSDEAAWWNLAIASTALKRWRVARESWIKVGIDLEVNDDEPNLDLGTVPIRINPSGNTEVVWARRIDPARAIILNIPFANSGHRYHDIVLNDGAPQGYRISDGKEYPVFNELELITRSTYKTYSCKIATDKQSDVDKLEEICKSFNVEMENWSTARLLCKQCSEGIPHEHHDNDLKTSAAENKHIGFAAKNEDDVNDTLTQWRIITRCDYDTPLLELE